MNDITQAIRECTEHPDDTATWTADEIRAGALVRRNVRYAFDIGRLDGADVQVAEAKGLLDSVFSVRATGTGRQLYRMLSVLGRLS